MGDLLKRVIPKYQQQFLIFVSGKKFICVLRREMFRTAIILDLNEFSMYFISVQTLCYAVVQQVRQHSLYGDAYFLMSRVADYQRRIFLCLNT